MKNLTVIACILATLDISSSLQLASPRQADGCPDACTTTGAHVISTRGSLEPPGPGMIGLISADILAACNGSDSQWVPYEATEDDYVESESTGIGNLTAMVLNYVSCCPDSKIVLLGYSQGAQVTADFLCGRTETGFPVTEAYASTVADNIAAVVLMGDPSWVYNQTWDYGTATGTSYFPRNDSAACEPVADKMISYCDDNDEYCDSGSSLYIHASYLTRYTSNAVDFVLGLLGDSCS